MRPVRNSSPTQDAATRRSIPPTEQGRRVRYLVIAWRRIGGRRGVYPMRMGT